MINHANQWVVDEPKPAGSLFQLSFLETRSLACYLVWLAELSTSVGFFVRKLGTLIVKSGACFKSEINK